MIKVGALWSKKSAKGEEYLNGKFGDAELKVFPNSYKEKENQPDFIVYLAESKERTEKSAGGNGTKPYAKPYQTGAQQRFAAKKAMPGNGEEEGGF